MGEVLWPVPVALSWTVGTGAVQLVGELRHDGVLGVLETSPIAPLKLDHREHSICPMRSRLPYSTL